MTIYRAHPETGWSTRFGSDLNRLCPQDRPVHDWYRFVLSFPPHLVRNYIERFRLDSQSRVLDPFCGTGTTLVECKKASIPSVGVEPNPMAFLASSVKVDWDVDPEALMASSRNLAQKALAELESQGISDVQALQVPRNGRYRDGLRSLPPEQLDLLLTGSISPLPLHKVLVLLDNLYSLRQERYFSHQLLALARELSSSIGNLQFGPEVGVGPAKLDAPVINAWLARVRTVVDDLRALQGATQGLAEVHQQDSRHFLESLPPDSIDAVITSPPYPNEKDYTRTTRLESVVLDLIRSKAELRALKQHLIRSNTRNVYKSDEDDRWVAENADVQRLAEEIESRRIAMGKTSGFERQYARVTKLYFGGMTRHLATLRSALRPGAQLAYVVGDQASYLRVMIRTGQILGDIARNLGYDLVGIDLFRTRRATATLEELREEVVLLRWPG